MDREKLMLSSIKKLIDLNVSEDEILLNLKEIGVNEEEAKELIKKSGGFKKTALEDIVAKEPIPANTKINLSKVIEKELNTIQPKEEPQPVQAKPTFSFEKYAKDVEPAISGLWEKGVLITVTDKLEEMKKLKKDIEKILDDKVNLAIESERKKMTILSESQKTLLVEKINSQLSMKSEEIEEVINAKIAEMSNLNNEIKRNIEELRMRQEEYKEIIQDMEKKKIELMRVKDKILTEMNTELIKSKSGVEDSIGKIDEHIQELETKVERTLALESQVVEGLVNSTEKRIDEIQNEKREELSQAVSAELRRIEETRAKIDVDKITAKIKQLEESRQELEKYKMVLEETVEQAILDSLEDYKKKLVTDVRKDAKIDDIKARLDDIKNSQENLSLFQKQFVNTIDANVEKFNKSINDMNKKTENILKEFDARKKLIDDKIEELTKFEKNFAKEMGIAVDLLVEKKAKK
ncbi:MAG: hypothetical protein COT15_02110 [Candidatus Diapherotrites archaeon CG08_land_8_20_14_0_20_34_12]|nr:MAG: hypothetical protein COT15_02110 [Candidatus Diapherotrites archaeon CG08_land_8_20_14_0_20_34_12]